MQFKTKPYAHQIRALTAGEGQEDFAYFMEMGTGKTKVSIDEWTELYIRHNIDAVVVLAPKGVYMNWVLNEIPAHMAIGGVVVEWRAGGGSKSHQKKLVDHLLPCNKIRVLVMNIEALSSGNKGINYLKRFLKVHRCYMVVDESTFIKNPRANRTKSVVSLGDLAVYRRIMTGAPVTRSPLDLFSQFQFLDPSLLGFKSYYAFRARYAVMQQMIYGGRKVQIVVGYRNMSDLTEKVKKHSFRVTKEECLDLPPKVYQRREVELTKEQQTAYTQMREFAIAELGNGEVISATTVITQLLRLHQIVCGQTMDDNGDIRSIKSNRVSALMDVISETDGKVVIWSKYRAGITDIVESLSKEYGENSVAQYHGGNVRTRQADVKLFLTDPECRFMVSNAQSGGYGNTWVVAHTVIYFSNDYDLEKRVQSEDRVHRVGQTKSVTYVDLVASGTVDEKILKALRNKINISTAIMGEGYREWII